MNRLWACALSFGTQGLAHLMNMVCSHSSKRVLVSQSISAIRLILATLTNVKTTCYGRPHGFLPRSLAKDLDRMNRRWIISILVLCILLASFPPGIWMDHSSVAWLAEWTEASETALPPTTTDRPLTAPQHIRHEQTSLQKARDLFAQLQAQYGTPLPGYVGGREFQNREQHLPPGHYREYDLNPKVCRGSLDAERIVFIQGTGRAYYTGDHYRTFTPLNCAP